MISAGLEQLILTGKAVWRQVSVGASGTLRIRVPENKFIVITDFTYFHFLDSENNTNILLDDQAFIANFTEYLKKSIHTIRFKSKCSTNSFIVKEPVQFFSEFFDLAKFITSNHHVKFDTYMIHDEDVVIEIISQYFGDQAFILTFAQPNIDNKMNNSPFGHADINTTLVQLFGSNLIPVPSDMQIKQLIDNYTGVIPPSGFDVNNLQFPYVQNITTLLYGGGGTANIEFFRNLPIINISYVEINGKKPDTIQG